MRFLKTLALVVSLVAAQPRWAIERSRLATILFGISYVDEFNGFVQGAQDGFGPLILRSRDGGSSYQQVAHSGSTLMFMSGAAHSATSAAAAGVGILTSGVQFTTDGNTYRDANVPIGFPPIGASQSGATVRGVPGAVGAFGFVGNFGSEDGVAFSPNGGNSWTVWPIPDPEVRYGAYPSMSTWYVSGGTWPNAKKATDSHRQLSEHLTAVYHNDTQRASVEITAEASTEKSGYVAFIYKTTDSGRTWQRVFYNTDGQYYFNGIDCSDVNNCLVVAEGSNGAQLFATRNGGSTWEPRLTVPGRAASLFDVKYVNAREAWACGGVLDISFTGSFYQSTDGGVNWVQHPMPGVYGTTLTFAPVRGAYHGHATALTIDGQSSTLVYK